MTLWSRMSDTGPPRCCPTCRWEIALCPVFGCNNGATEHWTLPPSERAAPALRVIRTPDADTLRHRVIALTAEEFAYLNSGRCLHCGHLVVVHVYDGGGESCAICGCTES